ncbi:hypothetical protein A2866_05020 [Candidatus Roizmanbacteria bacterium RIFCSPHIGHO2_01_FULL_39_8]|uniref:Uncharacterized protein n=3 Tax=Candidatus Roizmaniibacteriota TaxID=1752723 RepID=A0A1F7GJD9_9BACT|nr:MAG: hypothetical protein A2866_05020 [Candidatus Roizmanbacteria bacterium RIFCSPHIGHO2_01_FULL_39_8]OGK26323.1 MAG: hypothetical protein A3C28_02280 [Candidatus Roizmanbacteria bacterium RIFCSPHIGHO2_02_FULL_39_9]OGK35733.1 MAG: hypothetical protein A3F60_00350 [Candidatus Roizmanbacteria bacterium RIFCSPHIGHO2_12_FULL_39_8]
MISITRTIYSIDRNKLYNLTNKSKEILLKIHSIFPFDLFPNTIVVDEVKVSVIYRFFFASEQIRDILIKDIRSVYVDSSIFFAALNISFVWPRLIKEKTTTINYLRKNDALRAKNIIEGLMITSYENVEIKDIEKTTLVKNVSTIGRTQGS